MVLSISILLHILSFPVPVVPIISVLLYIVWCRKRETHTYKSLPVGIYKERVTFLEESKARPFPKCLTRNMLRSRFGLRKPIILTVVVLIVSRSLILFNWEMLNYHGSIAPWHVFWYTTPYHTSAKAIHTSYPVDPPEFFSRSSVQQRVVFSLTTMPKNLEYLRETIDSLTQQDFRADAIYVNLPKVNARTGEVYPPAPSWFQEYESYGLIANYIDTDYGPLTKLVGGLMVEHDPETMVVTVDDDKIYGSGLLRKLVWQSMNDPGSTFGSCGFSFLPMPDPRGVATVYTPWLYRGSGRNSDELQAVCGIIYRVSFFRNEADPDLNILKNPPKKCFTTDDLWIAAVLAMVHNIPRILVASNKYNINSTPTSEKDTTWNLSTGNQKPGVDIGCIRAAEKEFRRQWPLAKDM